MEKRQTMREWAGLKGWIIPLLLVTSLVLNIFGLILPFLEIDAAFSKGVIYSLPHSVQLMWEHKLYFVAGLILGFSIIFPFVKLISLFAAWFLPWKSSSREKFLHMIELLGKWSYMDIFVVVLLLALTSNQSFISSTIHVGVYCFISAITLSMITSEIIIGLARRQLHEEKPVVHYSKKRVWLLFDKLLLGWIVPVLVAVSAIALIEALNATFLRISQFFLVSRSYSVSEIIQLLQEQQRWVLLIAMVGTLAIFPLFRLLLVLISWIIPMSVGAHLRMRAIVDSVSRWCMLDVFGLALFLVTTEGKDLVKTEIQNGLYVVVVAIALSYLLGAIAIALTKSMVATAEVTQGSSDKP
jgi:paraquat-inducible protein A